MNDPAMAAIELRPSAVPRRLLGNASVRMAVELANRNAPPMPCTMRREDQPQRGGYAVHPGHGQRDRAHGEDREAQVVHAYPAEHFAQTAERDTTSTADTTRKPMNIHSR